MAGAPLGAYGKPSIAWWRDIALDLRECANGPAMRGRVKPKCQLDC